MSAIALSAATIAALKALAAIGGSVAVGGIISNENAKYQNKVNKEDALRVLRSNSDILNNLSDRELTSLLKNYETNINGMHNLWGLFGDMYEYDVDSALKDLANLSQFTDAMPEDLDYDAIYDQAVKDIEAENAEILALYDADKQRQTELYDQLLATNNDAYNRNVNQILSNDYQKNAQLMGTVRSEMNRSQRNALEAGASAGMRIAGNVNTLLSLQNKQSQQSLETSNNLAQMLLNQQQANAGIQSKYGNYLSQDTANRANLKAGTTERIDSNFRTRVENEEAKYNKAMENWENAMYATGGSTNPFADIYKSSLYKSQYNK